jgi:spermidine synthase
MPAPTESHLALVRTEGDRRSLEFTPGMIQSEMLLSQPDRLVLGYARAMMCFTLFKPRPRHIVMVGLGGGSLAKFCYRHLPDARITVLELRADVIALRQQFMIPPDDARLQIIHADAAHYLRRMPASVDVLLVDGFDEAGLPPTLCSPRFYADCRRALRDDGVLVANIFAYDTRFEAVLRRLGMTFNDRLCWFNGIAGNNRILFAVNEARTAGKAGAKAAATTNTRALRVQRSVALWHGLGLPWFNRMLADLVVRRLSRRRPADKSTSG